MSILRVSLSGMSKFPDKGRYEMSPFPDSPATREEDELENGAFPKEIITHDEPAGEVTCQEKGNVAEQNLVGLDEAADQDHANPMNWPTCRKWTMIAILSFITSLTQDNCHLHSWKDS